MCNRGARTAAWLAASAIALGIMGCGGDTAAVRGCTDPAATNYNPAATEDDGSCVAFQGPRNPDFEATGQWVSDSSNNYAGNGPATISAGTGFMPTHGIHFLQMGTNTSNNWYYGTSIAYQDDVSFDHSSSMTFDWAASGWVAGGCDVTVEILFTAVGTATLWSRTFSAAFDVQQMDETVALPALPERGRLTVRVSASGGQNTSASVRFDDFRVN